MFPSEAGGSMRSRAARVYQREHNKRRENPRIESADGREIKMHPLPPRNRVCLCPRNGGEVPSNYRGIQPIVTRFPAEDRARDCLKWSECGKRRTNRGEREEKGRSGKRGRRRGCRATSRRAKKKGRKKRFRRLPATETPRNRRRQSGKEVRDRK